MNKWYYPVSNACQFREEEEARVTINGTSKIFNCALKSEDCNAVEVTAACVALCPMYRILNYV